MSTDEMDSLKTAAQQALEALDLALPITHDAPSTYLALCYESGPYSVTKLRSAAIALIRAVERAHGIGVSDE